MTLREEKLNNIKSEIEKRLSECGYSFNLLKNPNANGRKAFIKKNGEVFCIDIIADYNSLVIEHAENLSKAELLELEDGDLFNIDDYSDLNVLFDALIRDIND